MDKLKPFIHKLHFLHYSKLLLKESIKKFRFGNFLNGPIPDSLSLLWYFLNSNWQTYVWKLSLPLLGFELRISGVGSDCSAYCLVRHNHIRLQRWHNRRIIRWLYVGLQQLEFMNLSNYLHFTNNVYCCQILSIISSFLSNTVKAESHT